VKLETLAIGLAVLGLTSAAQCGSPLTQSAPLNPAVAAQIQANAASAQAQNAAKDVSVLTNGRVTLLQLKDASAVPSEVLHSFKGKGKVLAIDRNGVIFGAGHPVDTRAISTAAMTPTNDQMEEIRKRLRGQKAPSTISTEVVGYGAEKNRTPSREEGSHAKAQEEGSHAKPEKKGLTQRR
jgi:hypothetical protein